MKNVFLFSMLFFILPQFLLAQDFSVVTASTNNDKAVYIIDANLKTGWPLVIGHASEKAQYLVFTLKSAGYVSGINIQGKGLTPDIVRKLFKVYITYDTMNTGDPVDFELTGTNPFTLSFSPKYGAYLLIHFSGDKAYAPMTISEVSLRSNNHTISKAESGEAMPWMNPDTPLEERINLLLSVMTPAEKMELLREGWGIPGIPHLGIPDIKKVEAIHGFSYGTGATVFPQSIAMGATWNRKLIEEAAGIIADETVSAHAIQAWSPVLDVAQDPRWGRCEETYGEDPLLVSEIGGAWIKGYQSRGLMTTPKHFGGHGAPLGGRDSHDIGLSEREWREVHLVPFRDTFKKYSYQSIMMAYSDYLGVPVAKNATLLKNILRDEWGFDGYIVSDCGAIGNLTSRKHYTAVDKIEAAQQSLAAGIATNCGDTYNDKKVIEAAVNGVINMKDIDFTCRTLLRVMFKMGLFEENPSRPLNWDKQYENWNSEPHRALARQVARESIVLLKNDGILPLSKTAKSIAVIGPGADDLQTGDYTGRTLPGQLRAVLEGVKAAVGKNTKVTYEKGCDFFLTENSRINKAVEVAEAAELTILVLGDCSSSKNLTDGRNTSGENNDLATLVLPGDQQRLLEAVCATGKPVVLVLQIGRPYALSYADTHCRAIIVNWLPGQEGGYATADVLFGDYNPAGRLPMTFPRHVGQVPLYYNFKTSGRRYEYTDLPYYPLYHFGYGLSYTSFEYKNLRVEPQQNGNVSISAEVKNTGTLAGDEVVQLYVTDMYASVKTRVMELKDFERIHLKPGEMQKVNFTLTPYKLSLLNDKMDRVVEPGEFKIMVGGVSPDYDAKDQIKGSLRYESDQKGVVASLDYPMSFTADFVLALAGVHKEPVSGIKTLKLRISNVGNMTDAGKITMYIDGGKVADDRHFELDPGENKELSFQLENISGERVLFVSKYRSLQVDL